MKKIVDPSETPKNKEKVTLLSILSILRDILQRHKAGEPILDRMAENIARRAENPHNL